MNVLVIGSDPRIFETGSESFRRIRDYAGLFGELHIVSRANRRAKPARHDNLFLWPAYSAFPFLGWGKSIFLGIKIARERAIDVVDAQDASESGLAAFLVARGARGRLRIQIHTDIMSPRYRAASWKEYLRYRIARFLIPHADCLRVVSERIRRSLLQPPTSNLQPKKICVLPIFTDASRFIAAAPDPETERRFKKYDFKMIAVGRFVDKEKNFSMLIELMREFVKICPRALLVIVGEGPDEKNYKLQITNYKLKNNVIVEPWRNDLPSFYQSFDLFLAPSNYEGWGRAMIEAMAAELPVVMTDVGLAGEVVRDGENGMVVSVGDQQSFLKAMIMLYQDQEKRNQFARAARQTAENLHPATNQEYLESYRDSFLVCKRNIE